MANWYISSTGWAAVAQWQASTGYSLGQYVRQLATPAIGNERVFKVTTAGTSGGTEPSWTLTNNSTTADGTVTWTQVAGQESEQQAGNWRAPLARLLNGITNNLVGENAYISHDHVETQASLWRFGTGGAGNAVPNYFCVNSGGSLPPVTADLRTTASISTTGANDVVFGGVSAAHDLYFYGINWHAGDGSNTALITFGAISALFLTFENCSFELANTSASSFIRLDTKQLGASIFTQFINTTVKFNAAAQGILPAYGHLYWTKTPSAVQGTAPTNLFLAGTTATAGSIIEVRSCDLSGATNTLIADQNTNSMAKYTIVNSKVAAGVTLYGGTQTTGDAGNIRIDNVDDTTNNRSYQFYDYGQNGNTRISTSIYRVGGAWDHIATHYSWAMTGVTATTVLPAITRRIARRYNLTGSAVTATIEILYNGASALTNTQIWLYLEALTTSGAPKSVFYSSRVSDLLATTAAGNQPTSTTSWAAPNRQNSHAYALDDAISVSSNSGRVFFCTTAGTSASSLPGGYASAVDGGSVTDGTAVFRAGIRQNLPVNFTPRVNGVVFAQVYLGSNITVYIDPTITIA